MDLLEELKRSLEKTTLDFKKELGGVRTNRPNSALVEDLKVNYYNEVLPLKQVGSVGVIPPRTIQIQVWDKEAIPGIVKAIESSTLNLSANIDGNIIRVNLPELSSERREELIKHIKKVSEEYRIKVRHLRDEANKKTQKLLDSHEVNEDQKFKLKEEIQREVDKTNLAIEAILESKVQEIKS